MAQFFWQPDPADEGNPPSNAVIIQPWDSFTELRVVEDGFVTGEYSLEMRETSGSGGRYGALFTELDGVSVPDSADVEVYMRYVASGSANEFMLAARADSSTTTAALTLYFGGLRRALGEGAIRKQVGGSAGDLASSSSLDQGADTYKQRLRVNGSDLSLKVWLASDPEPGAWDLTATDTDITAAGKVGYYQQLSTSSFHGRILDLGVGTDGDSAPTEDASGTTGEVSQTLPATSQALDGTSAAEGSLGITLAGGTFNIVPNSDFTMSGRRPLGEDTWDPNDPGTIAVVQGSASVNEDAGTITLSATRSGGTGAASVDWATVDGTAVAGTDYTADSNTFNWGDGQTGTRSATISITDRDGVAQGNTEFTWVLSGASGAEIRMDGGEPLDTTTVTINDQDTAGGTVNVLRNLDFSTGDWLQWHQPGDPNTARFNLVPPYGRPPEWGGNGDLVELVTSPQRGHSQYSARMTVKNGANWSEPDDCKPFPCDVNIRSTRMNDSAMYHDYEVMPNFTTWWYTFSVFIPNDWDPQGGSWGPGIHGIKPINDGSSGTDTLALHPTRWQYTHRHDPNGVVDGPNSFEWYWQMRYRESTGIGDGGYDVLEQDFPDPAVSRAAFASINKGGWTDWMFRFHMDWRDPGAVTNNGFIQVYKREDSGSVIHLLDIQPLASINVGGNVFPRGIGVNSDFFWLAGQGIYAPKVHFETAPNNQTLYFTNGRVYDGGDTITDIADYMLGLI